MRLSGTRDWTAASRRVFSVNLTSQGISIEGADAGKDKEQQEERQEVPLTAEEKAYFRDIWTAFPGKKEKRTGKRFLRSLPGEAERLHSGWRRCT